MSSGSVISAVDGTQNRCNLLITRMDAVHMMLIQGDDGSPRHQQPRNTLHKLLIHRSSII